MIYKPKRLQPRYEQGPAGLTADYAWLLFRGEAEIAFLDGRPGYGQDSRWSVLALEPWLTLQAWPDRLEMNGQSADGDFWRLLQQILDENRLDLIPDLPLQGGCIGFISYDAGFAENALPLPERAARQAKSGYPLISLTFYDCLIIFDRFNERSYLYACGYHRPAADSLVRLRRRLKAEPPQPAFAPAIEPAVDYPAEQAWIAKIEELREHIRLGDVYIANLTGQFTAQSSLPGDVLYDRLRRQNPAPFAAFIRRGPLEILSSSPERLLRIDRDGRLETRPIKGTRPRGVDQAEEIANRQALLTSGKDRAELLMITDLERNDLSRVCTAESVQVSDLFRLETYPAVHHLTATVTGRKKPGIHAIDCLRACFPGGSISGAPKAAAMKIIDRLEDQPRSLYTGSLGYFSLDGRADFNIMIRTAVKLGSRISYGAGGGITWESDPLAEYHEMLLKARAFSRMLKGE